MPGSRPRSRRSPSRRCAASSISRRRSTPGSPCSRASTRRVIDRCHERARPPHARRAGAGADDARATALIACSSRAASAASPTASPPRSASTRPSSNDLQIADGRLAGTVGAADRRRRGQAQGAARRRGCAQDPARGGARRRRRRQRHPDARSSRPRHRLSRQARGGRGRRRPDRGERPHRACSTRRAMRGVRLEIIRERDYRRRLRSRTNTVPGPARAGSCRRRSRRGRRRPNARRRRSRCRCRRRRGRAPRPRSRPLRDDGARRWLPSAGRALVSRKAPAAETSRSAAGAGWSAISTHIRRRRQRDAMRALSRRALPLAPMIAAPRAAETVMPSGRRQR